MLLNVHRLLSVSVVQACVSVHSSPSLTETCHPKTPQTSSEQKDYRCIQMITDVLLFSLSFLNCFLFLDIFLNSFPSFPPYYCVQVPALIRLSHSSASCLSCVCLKTPKLACGSHSCPLPPTVFVNSPP